MRRWRLCTNHQLRNCDCLYEKDTWTQYWDIPTVTKINKVMNNKRRFLCRSEKRQWMTFRTSLQSMLMPGNIWKNTAIRPVAGQLSSGFTYHTGYPVRLLICLHHSDRRRWANRRRILFSQGRRPWLPDNWRFLVKWQTLCRCSQSCHGTWYKGRSYLLSELGLWTVPKYENWYTRW